MELDCLVGGNFDDETFLVGGFRDALHRTTTAMSKVWRIPEPAVLMGRSSPSTPLSIMIEARRAVEIVFSRRRSFLCGVSKELRVSTELCSLLVEQSQQIDRMIISELGISRKPLLESLVVEAGGMTKEKLELEMIDNF